LENPMLLQPADQSGIHFGFSLAHLYDGTHRRLLVGAPRANTSKELQRPGALYSCHLDTSTDKCEQVTVKQDKYREWITEDIQDDQGLGFSLASDGKENIVVCAPRWHVHELSGSRAKDLPLGICFAKRGSEPEFESFSPPYAFSAVQDISYLNNGSCQFGMSVAHGKGEQSFTVGSPGCWNWQGDTWEMDLEQSLENVTSLRRVSHLTLQDVDQIYDASASSPLPLYTTVTDLYLGYSVAGIIFGGVPAIVSSMPRTVSTRQLKVDDRDTILGPIIYILQQDTFNQNKLNVMDKMKPPETSSNDKDTGDTKFTFFGYSLTTLDVNGDGLEDVVAGAPFYYTSTNYDQGAIFVYMQKTFHLPGDVSQQLGYQMEGEKTGAPRMGSGPHGRFGSCVAALGDIDNDGYHDVAVGAPFLPDGGAVFVYMGSSNGLEKEHKQVIQASSVSPHMQLSGFGFSISQRLPGDSGLGYDVAVGAYTSDAVLVFRSKVVLSLIWTLNFSSFMDLTSENCTYKNQRYSCVQVSVCLNYHKINDNKLDAQTLDFIFSLSADKAKQRLLFNTGSSSVNDVMLGVPEDTERCQTYDILAKHDIQDVVKPFPIKGEISLISTDNKVMLHPSSEVYKEVELAIQVHCASEDVRLCLSDVILKYNIVKNYTLMASQPIEISFVVENRGETAYNTLFMIDSFGDLLLSESTSNIVCQIVLANIHCNIDSIFTNNSKVEFRLWLIPSANFFSSLRTHEAVFNMTANVTTTSGVTNPAAAHTTFQIPITVTPSLDLTKEASVPGVVEYNNSVYFKTPSEATSEEELGNEIKHKFKIFNGNKFSIYATEVTLMWPLKIDGMYLLYPMGYPSITGVRPEYCVFTGEELKFMESSSDKGYQERLDTRTLTMLDKNVPGSVVAGKNTEYALFNCSFGELGEKEEVYIQLRYRLVQRTIEKLEVGSDLQNISSRAELKMLQLPLSADPPSGSYVSYIFTEISYKEGSPKFAVAWWVYLVSILGGLLLLVLIALILWKCGFFKRNRLKQPDNLSQKEKKGEEEEEEEEEDNPVTPHTPMLKMTENASEDFQFSTN
ncbi:hypothetical protein OTU49_014395, partial [Cherax quadricarinatus]